MATNRFVQSGQSQHLSQYVPYKLPFELWQQQIQQKDAKVQSDVDALKSQSGQDITGTDTAQLGKYSKSIYGDSELGTMINDIGEIQIGDRQRSQQSAAAINNKVEELLSDDYIMKSLTGDLADDIIQLNGEVKQHQAMNTIYDQRTKALEGIYKSVADKKDWELDPTLLFQQEQELIKMTDPQTGRTYIPKQTGVGDYFDASKYILDEVNRIKDSGSTSYDYNDPLYLKWSSYKGVPANKYAEFAEDIWNNQSSPVRADAERRISSLIDMGYYNEEDRAKLLEYEKSKLKKTAENLKHGVSDQGASEKSESMRNTESQNKIFILDQAETDVVNGVTSTLDNVKLTKETVGKKVDFYEQQLNKMLPKKLLDQGLDNFASMKLEDLQMWSRSSGIPIDQLVQAQNQYADLKLANDNLELAYAINDFNIRGTEGSGFNYAQESTYNLIQGFKENPAVYLQTLNNPNSPLRNTPQWQEFETIRTNNPELFEEMLSVANGESSVLNLYTVNDFKNEKGQFDSDAAIQFLNNTGIEIPVSGRSNAGGVSGIGSGNYLTESEFSKILRDNQDSNSMLLKENNKLSYQKQEYDRLSKIPVNVTDTRTQTYPGVMMSLDSKTLSFMGQAADANGSTLITDNGVTGSASTKQALINTITNSKTNLTMTMTGNGRFVYSGQAIGELLTDVGNKEVFLNELSMELFEGEPISDLSADQMKQLSVEYENLMKDVGSYKLVLSTSKSTSLNNSISDNVDKNVVSMDKTDPNYEPAVVTTNITSNRESLDQANKYNSNVVFNSYSNTTTGFVKQEQAVNIPFTVKNFSSGELITEPWSMVYIEPLVQESGYDNVSENSTNSNGTPYVVTDKQTGDTGLDKPQTDINGNPIIIYTFKSNNEIITVPAISPTKAYEMLILDRNRQQ